MSEAEAERYEVEEDSSPAYEETPENPEESARGEWIKFGLLAVVLLVTVLVIWLLRPLIFTKIVPAVLGEGLPSATLMQTETEVETLKPDAEEAEAEAAPEEEVESMEEEAGGGSPEATSEPENPADVPTAVPAQTHMVQPGETLTAIARQYGVTVQAIAAANNIPNPDRVAVGTVLVIPKGE